MTIRNYIALAALLMVGTWPGMARAQVSDPVVIPGTQPISATLHDQLEAYLAANPPSAAPYYAPTYVQETGQSTLVSLAALNLQSTDEAWNMEAAEGEASKVAWIGTVRIFNDGSGQMFISRMGQARKMGVMAMLNPKLAAPMPAPGGSPAIRLPFDPGKAMMYGVRLIHGSGDYGTSGMYAVDLVGGDSLGTNVASSTVYASATGEVEWKCADDVQVVVRTYDEAEDNYFVYAHLVDNSSLVLEHTFATGSVMGTLQYGSFTDDCGWSQQLNSVYHIHWMFEPAAGAFKVNNCTITLSDEKFHCGEQTIGGGGWITNMLVYNGTDDPTSPGMSGAPSFWDPLVAVIVNLVLSTANLIPAHNSASIMLTSFLNTAVLGLRLAWILIRGELNIQPLIYIVMFLIAVRIPMMVIWLVFWVIRVLRVIKQLVSPMG